jgi:hypothetical protein
LAGAVVVTPTYPVMATAKMPAARLVSRIV